MILTKDVHPRKTLFPILVRVSGSTITAPMVRQMEKNLTRGQDSRTRVAVAILQVAAEKDLQVEDRRSGSGRQPRNWLQETKAWAKERGLLQQPVRAQPGARRLVADKFPRIALIIGPPRRLHASELGRGDGLEDERVVRRCERKALGVRGQEPIKAIRTATCGWVSPRRESMSVMTK